jgi:hypothetical protein
MIPTVNQNLPTQHNVINVTMIPRVNQYSPTQHDVINATMIHAVNCVVLVSIDLLWESS